MDRDVTAMKTAELYAEMNELEEQGLALKARRKACGDEIRRRSAEAQLDAQLSGMTPDQVAALAARAQTVALAQADGQR